LADIVPTASSSVNYAILSSSAKGEDGNGNWTFSHAVLEGLSGDPATDRDNNGYVTLQEVAEHVQHEIAVYESNHSVFKTSGGFDSQVALSKTSKKTTVTAQPVDVWYNDQWWRAKMLGRSNGKARIRWIQLGYDTPEDDEWIDLSNLRSVNSSTK
jgi:hypothetical protein